MNKEIQEIHCITDKGKVAKNEWKNDDSGLLWALYSVHKKIKAILFPYFSLTFKEIERYISSDKSYKYLNKLIR